MVFSGICIRDVYQAVGSVYRRLDDHSRYAIRGSLLRRSLESVFEVPLKDLDLRIGGLRTTRGMHYNLRTGCFSGGWVWV